MGITAGELLSRTFNVFFKNLGPFLVLMLLINLPNFLLTGYTVSRLSLDNPMSWVGILQTNTWLSVALALVSGSVATGAITYGVLQQLRGQPVSIGTMVSVGISVLARVALVGIITGMLIALGLVLLIVPGVILAVMLSVSTAVAAVENVGISGALTRSRELTDGYRGTIFGALFVMGIIQQVPNFLINHMSDSPGVTPAEIRSTIVQILLISDVAMVVTGGLAATLAAIIYHDLRVVKEGADVNELAAVFE